MEQCSPMLQLTYIELEGKRCCKIAKDLDSKASEIGRLSDLLQASPASSGQMDVGEAIAFALGGNRKMLRASSLAGLLNQEKKSAGCLTAQVTLRMDILAALEVDGTGAAKSRDSNAVASPLHHPFASNAKQHQLEAGAVSGSLRQGLTSVTGTSEGVDKVTAAAEESPAAAKPTDTRFDPDLQAKDRPYEQGTAQQWLGIRRVLKGSSTCSYIKRPNSSSWVVVSQAELQMELAAYNIHTQVVDRYIVAQSRQAVDVADAIKLVKHLEVLTGTGDYEVQIEELGNQIQELDEKLETTQQRISSLESERDQLAPHVAHWHKVQKLEVDFMTVKVALLLDQQQHGSRLIDFQQKQVHQVQKAESAATEQLQLVRQQEQQLMMQEAATSKLLNNCNREEQSLKRKVERLSASAAASKVHLSSATATLKSQEAVADKLQAKVDKLLLEESEHKRNIARLQQQAGQLQFVRDKAQKRLAAEQAAAAATKAQTGHSSSTGKPLNTDSRPSASAMRLQQDLAAVEDLLKQTEAVKAAADTIADRAAAHVAAMQKKLLKLTCMIEQTHSKLAAAKHKVEATAATVEATSTSAQAAEQQWKDAHWKQCSLQEELQILQSDLQQHQQHLQQGFHEQQHHSTRHMTSPGSWPAYDTAIQQLQQQLPAGSFYGRFTNCMFINVPSAAAAVNMALQELCDMNRALIVRDRQTAIAVIDYFKQQQIGTVQCKILSECSSRHRVQGNNSSSSSVDGRAAGGSDGPLLDYVTAAAGMPDEFNSLLNQLLGSWLLVTDRQEANRLLPLRNNLVTRSGEVFKADGEIVINIKKHTAAASSSNNNRNDSSHPYSLQCGRPTPIAGVTQQTGSTAAAAAAREAASKKDQRTAFSAIKASEQEIKQVKQQLMAAQRLTSAAAEELKSARSNLLHQQQQLASAETYVQQVEQQQQAEGSNASRTRLELQQQLAATQQRQQLADREAAAAAAAVAEVQKQQAELILKTGALGGSSKTMARELKSAAAAAGVFGGGTSGLAVLTLSKTAEELAAAEAAVTNTWQQIDQVQQQQKRTASRATALKKELQKVKQAAENQQEVSKLQDKLAATEQQLAADKQDLQTAQADKILLSNKLKVLKQQSTKAEKAAATANKQQQEYKAELLQQQNYLNKLYKEQERRQALLDKLQPQQQQRQEQVREQNIADVVMQDTDTAPAAAAGEVPHNDEQTMEESLEAAQDALPSPRRSSRQQQLRQQRQIRQIGRKACVVQDNSSGSTSSSDSDVEDSDDNSSNNDSDEVATDDNSNARITAGSHQRMQQQQQRRQQQLPDPDKAAATLTREGQRLQRREQQLAHQEHHLQQQQKQINEAALDRELATLEELESALGQLQQLGQKHDAAAAQRDKLLDERYSKLLSVLQQLNLRLDEIYKQLTGGAGSAYCAYTQERRLLFSQGVTVHVQPDGRTWRRFSMLSGGQQALATLAISFALQALFPSPFYFFDEVDCALDTIAAGRVAAYVKSLCCQSIPGTAALQFTTASAAKAPQGCLGSGSSKAAAQYVLVSHRPVVFESAGCLVGVYSNGRGSSAAVVAQF